jgi:type IV pilus assembly protein PilB
MGVQPFLMASTIELIIAQRLVRKLCPNCKIEHQPDEITATRVNAALENISVKDYIKPETLSNQKYFKGKEGGCKECDGIGYRGRVGLYEVMRMNNEIRRMILAGAAAIDIEKTAIKTGMVTLEQAGLAKALEGLTSLEEVFSVSKKFES